MQVPGAGARVWWRAVRLPRQKRSTDAERSAKVLPTNHISPGLLPQSLHLVRENPTNLYDVIGTCVLYNHMFQSSGSEAREPAA